MINLPAALLTAAIVLAAVRLTLDVIRAFVPKRLRGLVEFLALGPALWLAVEIARGVRGLYRVARDV